MNEAVCHVDADQTCGFDAGPFQQALRGRAPTSGVCNVGTILLFCPTGQPKFGKSKYAIAVLLLCMGLFCGFCFGAVRPRVSDMVGSVPL
jgi:hypothetical protein